MADDIGQELYSRGTNVSKQSDAKQKEKRAMYDAIGVELDIKNLNYSVIIANKRRDLLRDVNFHLEPGEMCALMGPSGAGKR